MVVITSRMVQTIGEVPIPITSVENKQITRSSNVRLNETLTEQAGLLVNLIMEQIHKFKG